jgi:hypothetical protein
MSLDNDNPRQNLTMLQTGVHSFLVQTLVPLLHIFAAADASLLFMTDGAGAPCNECGLRRQDSRRVEGVHRFSSDAGIREASHYRDSWPQDTREQRYPLFGAGEILTTSLPLSAQSCGM